MLKKNIMPEYIPLDNGDVFDENHNKGVGAGIPDRWMKPFLDATTDKKVTVRHNHINCTLDWEPYPEAEYSELIYICQMSADPKWEI